MYAVGKVLLESQFFFSELGMRGRSLKLAVKNMADSAASPYEWLWIRRKVCDGGKER